MNSWNAPGILPINTLNAFVNEVRPIMRNKQILTKIYASERPHLNPVTLLH